MISKINCLSADSKVNFKGAKPLYAKRGITDYLKEFNASGEYKLPVTKNTGSAINFSKFAARFKNFSEGIAKLCGSIFH